MHDVCLQRLPVLFCLDRAGVVGSDGPTHHGIYDIPMLRCLPNLTLMQPKDARELAAMMKTALAHDGPVVIRYPREPGPAVEIDPGIAPLSIGMAETVEEADGPDGAAVWFWALGDMLPLACETAARLRADGMRCGVVNARFIKPLDTERLWAQARQGARFVTLENGAVAGGFGTAVREALAAGGFDAPVRSYGWPDEFVGQGSTPQLMQDHGLTPERLAQKVANCYAVATH
jgi:1-deoxy-D-xylulose-5-phosphate synthase